MPGRVPSTLSAKTGRINSVDAQNSEYQHANFQHKTIIMCIAQTNKRHLTIVSKKSSISSLSLTTTTAKRPRLPGRFAASARLNLNRLWSELEEMYVGRTSSSVLVLPATTSSFNHQLQDTEDADQQNRINEEREQQLLKTNS